MPSAAAIQALIDEPYTLTAEQIRSFREDGFVQLPGVFTGEVLDHYGPAIREVTYRVNPQKNIPLEDRTTYGKAFVQVGNLWEKDDTCREFAFGKRLARIASELMGTVGVRMYHDQALCKEPGGGFTPWHADQQYWPLATGLSVTAWVPLQAVPIEMGPLCFGKGSHRKNIGRDLPISDDSEKLIRDMIKQQGIIEIQQPFALGDVSFHAGWTLHRAGPNSTAKARDVHTIIYMDEDMKLAAPKNSNQQNDWDHWAPGIKVGQIMNSPKNPVLYSSRA